MRPHEHNSVIKKSLHIILYIHSLKTSLALDWEVVLCPRMVSLNIHREAVMHSYFSLIIYINTELENFIANFLDIVYISKNLQGSFFYNNPIPSCSVLSIAVGEFFLSNNGNTEHRIETKEMKTGCHELGNF